MRLIAPLLLVACAGEADKSDTGEAAGTPATFVQVRDEVLVRSCGFGSCHGAGAAGLQIDGDMTADALVDVSSTVLDDEILVVAGDSEVSYLIAKMEAAAGIEGDVMPPSGAISQARIDIVRGWIDSGAPQ